MKLWLKIIIIIAVLSLVGGGIFGIVKLVDQGKFDTKKISNLAYGIGGLDGQGKYMNTDRSIYTKDAFECQGLNCTLAFDNDISYQIYFYDQNNEFVHTTGKLTGAFVQESVPFFAKYARIVITPNDDNKVSMLEVMKYAKQLKTTVYREQGFKNYTENLLVYEMGYYYNSSGVKTACDSEHQGKAVTTFVDFSAYSEGLFFKVGQHGEYARGLRIYFFDASRSFISSSFVSDVIIENFVTSAGKYCMSLNRSLFPEDCKYISFVIDSADTFVCELYCR